MRAWRLCGIANSGQALTEVALMAPLILVLLIGAVDIGRLSEFDTELAATARAGAQYGAANLVTAADTSGMQSAAAKETGNVTPFTVTASNFCQCYGSTGTVSCTGNACASTHRLLYVTVTASGTFKAIFQYFPGMRALTPSRTMVMQVGQ